jgi:hypothetical protein
MIMPYIQRGLHRMDDLRITVGICNDFAWVQLAGVLGDGKEDFGKDWTLYFKSVDSIREFQMRLKLAISAYDLKRYYDIHPDSPSPTDAIQPHEMPGELHVQTDLMRERAAMAGVLFIKAPHPGMDDPEPDYGFDREKASEP